MHASKNGIIIEIKGLYFNIIISCYLKIKSAGAKGLSVYFKNFIIPEGAELFLYNENKSAIAYLVHLKMFILN